MSFVHPEARITTKAPDKTGNAISQSKKLDISKPDRSLFDRVLHMQRTIGNQAVQRLIGTGVIQANLKFGQANDSYEQEADRAAEQVMHTLHASPMISRRNVDIQRAEAKSSSSPAVAEDAAIASLDLAPKVKEAANKLKEKHPDIVFTSGRRSVAEQASAMASNIVTSSDRKWIEQTYAKSDARDKLQEWVNKNPDAKTKDKIALGLETTMNAMSDSERGRISKHLSGEAFDIQPREKDAETIKNDIKALSGITQFLDTEGGLVRWHAQFKRANHANTQNDVYEVERVVEQALQSSGKPLDFSIRTQMESSFNSDFSRVRVHTDAKAAETARMINAKAFTIGQDIVFGLGQYAPGKASGMRLLAHELVHTIQQRSSKAIANTSHTIMPKPEKETLPVIDWGTLYQQCRQKVFGKRNTLSWGGRHVPPLDAIDLILRVTVIGSGGYGPEDLATVWAIESNFSRYPKNNQN